MERWSNRVAVITGCSSGIGLQTAKDLLKANVKVVGLDKRYDRLVEQRNLLSEPQKNNFHLKKCDVTSESEVDEVFDWIEKELGGTDILVNNAGCLIPGQIVDLPLEHLKCMIDTNMMGIIYCTRKAFKSMKSRDVAGHVININSIDGHQCVPGVFTKCSMNIYPVTKFAVTAMTEIFRQEFDSQQTKIKVTSISPGLVDTELVPDEARVICEKAILSCEDVSGAILYALGTGPRCQVHEITLKPLGEKF